MAPFLVCHITCSCTLGANFILFAIWLYYVFQEKSVSCCTWMIIEHIFIVSCSCRVFWNPKNEYTWNSLASSATLATCWELTMYFSSSCRVLKLTIFNWTSHKILAFLYPFFTEIWLSPLNRLAQILQFQKIFVLQQV